MIQKIGNWIVNSLVYYVLMTFVALSFFVPVYVGFVRTGAMYLIFNLIPLILAVLAAKGMNGRDQFIHSLYSASFGAFLAIEVNYDPSRLSMLGAMWIPAVVMVAIRIWDLIATER